MQTPKILVPILVDALIVDDVLNAQEWQKWARTPADYRRTLALEAPYAEVLAKSNVAPTGVHLQWILPDALCKGEETARGALEFRPVPNRWLVTRLHTTKSGELAVQSWLVLSDFITEKPKEAANYLIQNEAGLTPVKLGKVIDLKDFRGDAAGQSLFLTAVGAGDVAFNSFTPNNENVFSFIDTMQGLEAQALKLTYLVAGWYSNPTFDPFFKQSEDWETIAATMHRLNCSFSEVADDQNLDNINETLALKKGEQDFQQWTKQRGTTPDFKHLTMLCHGAIYSVRWNGKSGKLRESNTGKPDAETKPQIVIANSGFEAMLRLVQQKMLGGGDENKGDLSETQQIARLLTAFEHRILNDMEKAGGAQLLEKETHKSWFEGGGTSIFWNIEYREPQAERRIVAAVLDDLNRAQTALNRLTERNIVQQSELYSAWIATAREPQRAELRTVYERKLSQTEAEQQRIGTLTAERDVFLQKVKQILSANFGEKATLRTETRPQFWEANEPTVLIHAAKAADKYGFARTLTCRYSGQFISEMRVFQTEKAVQLPPIKLPNADKIPLEIPDLIRETVLLSPDFSEYLRQFVRRKRNTTAQDLEKQQTLIWNSEIYRTLDAERLTAMAGFVGKRPAFRAFKRFQPTWSPLFLDWKVKYYPNGDSSLKNWQFKGFDFEFENNEFDENRHLTLQGRSLLTTQIATIFEAKLKEFRATLGKTDQSIIDNVIALFESLDILTQRLSGFNDFLLGQDINDIIPITDPRLAKATAQAERALPLKTAETFALRNGFLVPEAFRITDDFGIALTFEANATLFLKGNGMDTSETEGANIFLLPPRIVAPARLTLDLLGTTTQRPLYLAHAEQPILGWLMLDYLDKSIEIFADNGQHLGELITFKRAEKAIARWLPNSDLPLPNTVQRFLDGVLNYENSGSALSAMMNMMDAAISNSTTAKFSNINAFALLFGRPLALVRVRIELEVKGDKGVEALKGVSFSVKIGQAELPDNGLIGYFKNDDFSRFYALNDKDLSGYLALAAEENLEIGQALELVLLVNPTGKVHAVSGILPTLTLDLPQSLSNNIENFDLTFRVKPIISEANRVQIPEPSDRSKTFVWQQTAAEPKAIEPAVNDAHFPKGRNVVKEGWLKVGR